MATAAMSPPHPLSMNPVVVVCNPPLAAPVPVPVPVRPAFNWHNTSDRLREGVNRPLLFENDELTRRHRHSIFREMGLHDEEEDHQLAESADATVDQDSAATAAFFARTRRRPSSGIFLTNFLRLGLEDDHDDESSSTYSGRLRLRSTPSHKRLSWPFAMHAAQLEQTAGPSPPTISKDAIPTSSLPPVPLSAMSAASTNSSTVSNWSAAPATGSSPERKRPWYTKFGSGSFRRLRRQSSL